MKWKYDGEDPVFCLKNRWGLHIKGKNVSNSREEFEEHITAYSLRAGGGLRITDEVCSVINLILLQKKKVQLSLCEIKCRAMKTYVGVYVWLQLFLISVLDGCSQLYVPTILHPARGLPMSFGAHLDAMERE
jgi:hypothetical protein